MNPFALTAEERAGAMMAPARAPDLGAFMDNIEALRAVMGGSLASRMARRGDEQAARWDAGERSPTLLTEENIWLADDVAGGMVGPIGLMGAIRSVGENALKGRAERLAAALDKMGISYTRKGSGLSGSQYFEFYDKGDEFRKVRVSDHELPPTYGAMHGYADVEIGPHMSGSDYEAALDRIADWTGTKVPPRVKAGFAAAKSKQAAYEKRIQEGAARLMADRERYASLLREAAADPEIRPLLVRAKNASSADLAERVGEARAAFEKKYRMAEPPGAIGFSRGALKRLLGDAGDSGK